MAEGDGGGGLGGLGANEGYDTETQDTVTQAITSALTGKSTSLTGKGYDADFQAAVKDAEEYGKTIANTIALPAVIVSGTANANSSGASGTASTSSSVGTGRGGVGSSSTAGFSGLGADAAAGLTGGSFGGFGGSDSLGSTGSVATSDGGIGGIGDAGGGSAGAIAAVTQFLTDELRKGLTTNPDQLAPLTLARVFAEVRAASRGNLTSDVPVSLMQSFVKGYAETVLGTTQGITADQLNQIQSQVFNNLGISISTQFVGQHGLTGAKDFAPGGVLSGTETTDPTPWGRTTAEERAQQQAQVQAWEDQVFGRNPVSMLPFVTESINPDTRTPEQVVEDLMRELQDPDPFEFGPKGQFGSTQGPSFAQLGERGTISDVIEQINQQQFEMDPSHLADIDRGLLQQDRMNQTVLNQQPPPAVYDEDFLLGPNANMRGIMTTQSPIQATDPFGRSQTISDPFGLLSRGPNDLDFLDPIEADFNELTLTDDPTGMLSRTDTIQDQINDVFTQFNNPPSLHQSTIDNAQLNTDLQGRSLSVMDTALNPMFDVNTQINNAFTDLGVTDPVDTFDSRFGFPDQITSFDETGLPGVNSAITSFDVGDPSGRGIGVSTDTMSNQGATSTGGISSGGISGGFGGIAGDPSGGLLGAVVGQTDPGAGDIPPDLLRQMIEQGMIRV